MAKMRIDYKILKQIEKDIGDYQIGAEKDKLYFRFGYWQHIDKDLFASMLPAYLSIEQFIVDEDDDTGIAYIYYVWDDRFRKEEILKDKKERDFKLFGWSLLGLALCILYIVLDAYIF